VIHVVVGESVRKAGSGLDLVLKQLVRVLEALQRHDPERSAQSTPGRMGEVDPGKDVRERFRDDA
jgi:hypothetical protein